MTTIAMTNSSKSSNVTSTLSIDYEYTYDLRLRSTTLLAVAAITTSNHLLYLTTVSSIRQYPGIEANITDMIETATHAQSSVKMLEYATGKSKMSWTALVQGRHSRHHVCIILSGPFISASATSLKAAAQMLNNSTFREEYYGLQTLDTHQGRESYYTRQTTLQQP